MATFHINAKLHFNWVSSSLPPTHSLWFSCPSTPFLHLTHPATAPPSVVHSLQYKQTRMWANAQRDGRPAEHRWRPLVNAAKFGLRPLLECHAVMLLRRDTRWNMMGCPKPTNRSKPLVGRCSPYCGDIWRTYCCLTSFSPIVDTCLGCKDIARQSCAMVPRWQFLANFFGSCIFNEPRAAHFRPAF